MLTSSIFAPGVHNFLIVLAIVAALAVGWAILRFFLRLTRIMFSVGCLGILAITVVLVVSVWLGRGLVTH
jgi:hypothetical protein